MISHIFVTIRLFLFLKLSTVSNSLTVVKAFDRSDE